MNESREGVSQPSIEYVSPSNVNVGIVALKLHGKLVTDDAAGAIVRMQEAISRAGRLRVFFDIAEYDGFELGALWEKLKAAGSLFAGLERVAVIGDQRWAEWWSRLADPITPFVIRHFSVEHAEDARAWITEGLDV